MDRRLTYCAEYPVELETRPVTENELDQLLSEPSSELVRSIRSYQSPLLVLGAGGKMGPTLCALAQQAARAAQHPLDVIAVSRFSDAAARNSLESRGIKTIACNLLDPAAVQSLPDSPNIVYLAGQKFGTSQNPSATWALNALAPARVCERFPQSRIIALSTGNVYPMSAVKAGGSVESDSLTPLGEYPNAAVARERIFEFYSRENGTPVVLLRLFYAVEARYGVLADIARKIHAGAEISLESGFFNCIWQRDANDMVLRALCLAASPPAVFNLCRDEIFSLRDVAARFGELLEREPRFTGEEAGTALLGNAGKLTQVLGHPPRNLESMLRDIAAWVRSGGRSLNKPTHFEVRDGKY